MAEIIRMPRMSDTMEEGNIVEWLKKVGDKIETGDILAEVETDKATMELESFYEGTLLYIGVESGLVPVEGLLAIIGEKDEDIKSILEAEKDQKSADDQNTSTTSDTTENAKSIEIVEDSNESKAENISDDRIKASPLAKSMASKSGIDLQQVKGTGEGGRIVKRDIEAYVPSKSVQSASAQTPSYIAASLESKEVPVSQMRKVIARRLSESKYSSPHFYLTMDINMDNIVEARKEINANSEIRISFNDFVVKACAAALRKHPKVNSSWKGDKMLRHGDINIGVAVAVEDGLLVPVINHTDRKSLTEIKLEVVEKAGRAKNRKLQPQEMQGNTFTISNLGMFGIDEFTAIINPPDACILAVGSIVKKPVVQRDTIGISSIMKVTLSCDHRIVDGATGAKFLQTLRSYLENPIRILV